jgi:hypothetical protein
VQRLRYAIIRGDVGTVRIQLSRSAGSVAAFINAGDEVRETLALLLPLLMLLLLLLLMLLLILPPLLLRLSDKFS